MKKGMTVVLAGALAAVVAAGLVTRGSQAADYKGAKLCKMCHRGIHKPIVNSYEKTTHPKAMQKADAAGAIVGDFSSNSAFGKDKVAYVLGTGRTEQAYLDADFQVLPAIWDVKTKRGSPRPPLTDRLSASAVTPRATTRRQSHSPSSEWDAKHATGPAATI